MLVRTPICTEIRYPNWNIKNYSYLRPPPSTFRKWHIEALTNARNFIFDYMRNTNVNQKMNFSSSNYAHFSSSINFSSDSTRNLDDPSKDYSILQMFGLDQKKKMY